MNGQRRGGFPDFMSQYKEGTLLGIKMRQMQLAQEDAEEKRRQETIKALRTLGEKLISAGQVEAARQVFKMIDLDLPLVEETKEEGPSVTQERAAGLKQIPVLGELFKKMPAIEEKIFLEKLPKGVDPGVYYKRKGMLPSVAEEVFPEKAEKATRGITDWEYKGNKKRRILRNPMTGKLIWGSNEWIDIHKPETGKAGADTLKQVATSYRIAIGRYYNAKRGVDEYVDVPKPVREQVANEAKKQADIIAKRYKELGGNLSDLGAVEQEELKYKTAEEVRNAYQAGEIDVDTATQILRKQFGFN